MACSNARKLPLTRGHGPSPHLQHCLEEQKEEVLVGPAVNQAFGEFFRTRTLSSCLRDGRPVTSSLEARRQCAWFSLLPAPWNHCWGDGLPAFLAMGSCPPGFHRRSWLEGELLP
jgi:hypothetical protein